jgi:hypothetical protein
MRNIVGFTQVFTIFICGLALTVWSGLAYANGDGAAQQQRVLEITYGNKAKQVIPLDQPSGNISAMTFTGVQGNTSTPISQQTSLTKGWDDFSEPLSFGQVSWSASEGRTSNNLEVNYYLSGAMPNHEFTVGVHLFNPANSMARPNVTGFGSAVFVAEGVISREGKTSSAIAYDFGSLKTNANGDGSAQFKLSVPPGNYNLQFTVRIGGMNTCVPSRGAYGGCSIAYRTGNKFGEKLETIVIP